MSGVKRYSESCMEGGGVAPDTDGDLVDWKDYEALALELDRQSVITGDYIAQRQRLQDERDELRAQVAELKHQLETLRVEACKNDGK